MMRRPAPKPDPVPGDPESIASAAAPAAPQVRLIKRAPVPAPEEDAARDKVCAECGIRFRLEPGKKYFLCPDCYRRSFTYRQRGAREAARILTHITCARCGTQEYVPFVPEDPAQALCRACFAAERPEPKRASRHTRR
jgi:CxxC-x17-CxxC domain-containing protein